MSPNRSNSLGFGATQLISGPVSYSRTRLPSGEAALTNGTFRNQDPSSTRDEFAPDDEFALTMVIRAAYRQVFGNVQPMESERCISSESRLRQGEITVREFVRQLAKSEFYRSRYFESVGPHRSVELSFKHLLGRGPTTEAEVTAQVAQMATGGFDAAIDHLLDSDEYFSAFGEDTVPYARSWGSAPGMPQASFNRIALLEQNFAGSDTAIGAKSQLLGSLAQGIGLTIKVPAQVYRSAVVGGGGFSGTGTARTEFSAVKRALSDGGDSAPMRGDLYVGFGLGQREQEVFARTPGDSPDLIQALIRATYRQVMGNPHLMESERNITAESKFAEGVSSTREFVRAIALSAEYSRRFFASNAPYRFVELNFKHLLGRAPTSQAEVSEHIQRLATHGYEAEINSYVDSAEYQQTFGEDTIPYQRIATEAGRSQVAFNRHLSLAQGYAASDTVQSASSLVASVATNGVPSNWNSTTQRINRVAAASGTTEPTGKRYRIVVQAQPAGGRQRTPNASYLVSGKDMTSQLGYIHRRGGRIVSITEVI
ncbi:phycobilisome rod-core linker polypeptide [Vulcanococcus sp.]|jgi:phycoerythrin-associated linker protein|uniref:phycobilisome rod-core linker polypeptide n=1 Tax=Vulcanococcus sp. TaxID=2856995 RepID=UPI0037D9EBD8